MEGGQQERALRYLLGQMSEAETIAFEEEYFQDDNLFEQMVDIENDLVDSYVRGELSETERRQFENGYLGSSPKRKHVRFARALTDSSSGISVKEQAPAHPSRETSKPESTTSNWPARIGAFVPILRQAGHSKVSWLRPLTAGAVVAIAVVLLFWTFTKHPFRPSHANEQIASISFSLEPGLTRLNGGAQISIPAEIKQVQFQLELARPAASGNYRAVLNTPERTGVWSGAASLTVNKAVVTVPAQALPRGDYTLELQANRNAVWEEIETYYFRMLR